MKYITKNIQSLDDYLLTNIIIHLDPEKFLIFDKSSKLLTDIDLIKYIKKIKDKNFSLLNACKLNWIE